MGGSELGSLERVEALEGGGHLGSPQVHSLHPSLPPSAWFLCRQDVELPYHISLFSFFSQWGCEEFFLSLGSSLPECQGQKS